LSRLNIRFPRENAFVSISHKNLSLTPLYVVEYGPKCSKFYLLAKKQEYSI